MNQSHIRFDIATIEQLMNVRSLLMELAFEEIRDGANPYEHFLQIDYICIIAFNELHEEGHATIFIDETEQN